MMCTAVVSETETTRGQTVFTLKVTLAVRPILCMHLTHKPFFLTLSFTVAIFMSGICSELHYHDPAPAFVLAFVGSPAGLCACQMSRLNRLHTFSISVNN